MKLDGIKNRLGYLGIDHSLQEKLFGNPDDPISNLTVARVSEGLKAFGLRLPTDQIEETLETPEIGMDFYSPEEILEKALKPTLKIKSLLLDFSEKDIDLVDLRNKVAKNLNAYWTLYKFDGTVERVSYPRGDIGIHDVETYVKRDSYPVMAGYLSQEGMHIWLHPSLVTDTPFYPLLISIGPGKTIIGHNVSYDAIRLEESYHLLTDEVNCIDTMSMHIAVAGMSSKQKTAFSTDFYAPWKRVTSNNNLVDCYNLHCKPIRPLTQDDKEIRNIFVYGDLPAFKANLLDLIHYMILDHYYTFELFKNLFKTYLFYNPEAFTLKGLIKVCGARVPVVSDWENWLVSVEKSYFETKSETNKSLTELATELVKDFKADTLDMSDPWVSQLDWTIAKTGKNKGIPKWYRLGVLSKIKDKGEHPISTSSNLAPILLKLSWEGSPLFKSPKSGWCFNGENGEVRKVPHPKGVNNNCGNPLGKEYIKYMENDTLTSLDPRSKEIIQKAKSISYWKSMRTRVACHEPQVAKDTNSKMIRTCIVPHGTVTRRATESTFLVMSDIKPNIVGSELKSRIQAPKGFVLVGADFDSQEMRIGAAKADSFLGLHGSSPMSLTQMVGSKHNHTDSHSLLAKDLDLWPDRQLGKTLNFLMLFFGGVKGLSEAIVTALGIPFKEAETIAKKAIGLRRGKKDYSTGLFKGGTDSHAYNYMLRLADTEYSRTVLGKSAAPKPLQKRYVGKDHMPSRCNRSIQSAGVDILHLFLTFLDYYIAEWKLEGNFIISVHDEVWTLVRYNQRYLMAWAFQLSHMLTWTIFFKAYGFSTIPYNYLFFSSVNIDTVLRKEVDNCTGKTYTGTKTVSNPNEEIPMGEKILMGNLATLINH